MATFRSTLGLLLGIFFLTGQARAQSTEPLQYRDLGPYRGGRVTAVAGFAGEPGTFYLGATGGGVWKTTDYGASWRNVSDGYFATPSIGAIAVAPTDPNIVYVGTGTDGLRSNLIAGKGVYKSIDGGESWMHLGLDNVGQIGALIIHPANHNIVYVAAIGQAFNANPERGIYKTVDGGKHWEQVLYHSPQVGFSDVEMLPGNPDILFAAAWKAERKPWTITSGGTPDEGGIYKSVDAGATWQKITAGLPAGLIGKIDLELCPADSRIVYALVEAPADEGGLYKSTDQGQSFSLVSSHEGIRTRPFYYTNVRVDPTNPDIVYALAAGYYQSTDGGEHWQRISSPHGDNHDMWINPNDPDLFIQSNDGGANVTHNGGRSWSTQFNQPTAEIYQVEVDDQYPYWLYGGMQDNYTTIAVPSLAPDARQVDGTGWIINTGGCETGPAVPKPGNHHIVYSNCKGRFGVFDKRTGTERAYYVGAANMYGHNPADLRYRFQRVSPIHVSPHDPDVVYHCSQFVHRTTDEGRTWETISPDLTAFEPDKQVISGGPITRDITGEEFYSTIYAIRESTVQPGLIWTGANDGPVYVTRDNGKTWQNVTPKGLPPGGRVDAVEPSPHAAGKAFICVLRYQLGDSRPYIYRTENFGESWTLITEGIPADTPVRVVREDPEREGLLFAGAEYGMYLSANDGEIWKSFQQNLPVTPVTDIKVHEGDLVLSTMGRGFWIMDDITPLRDPVFARLIKGHPAHLFAPRPAVRYRYPRVRDAGNPFYPQGGAFIHYWLPETPNTPLLLTVLNEKGEVVQALRSGGEAAGARLVLEDMSLSELTILEEQSLTAKAGLNRFVWDLTYPGPWHERENRRYRGGPMVEPGRYTLQLTVGEQTFTQTLEVTMDPRVLATGVTAADVHAQVTLARQVADLLGEARRLEIDWTSARKTLAALETATDEDAARLQRLEEALAQLKTEEDLIYPRPMLTDQISYLYRMLTDADQRPGQDAYERYGELRRQLARLKERLAD